MKKWEIFEKDATKYLEEQKLNDSFLFSNLGSNNSTAPDIKAFKHTFNIEVKLSPAQAGQIVVTNNNNAFAFSKNSVNQEIDETTVIIKHLNKYYNKYSIENPIPITGINETLYSFIKSQYIIKGNTWIISADNEKISDAKLKCLVPINEIQDNFNVSATLRRKKSGSSSMPKSQLESAKKIILSACQTSKFTVENGKNIVSSYTGKDRLNHNVYLSKKDDCKYEIKKLSSTNNLNVVFELVLKKGCKFKSIEFRKYLDNL